MWVKNGLEVKEGCFKKKNAEENIFGPKRDEVAS